MYVPNIFQQRAYQTVSLFSFAWYSVASCDTGLAEVMPAIMIKKENHA
jgi:hypothetical protein